MRWIPRFLRRRAPPAVRPHAIADAPHGQRITIKGRVEAAARTIKPPCSDLPCVYCQAEIFEVSGEEGERSRRIYRDYQAADFLLRDATGSARVRTKWIDVQVARRGPFAEADSQWIKWNLHPPPVGSLRVHEWLVEVGAYVSVTGTSRRDITAHPYRSGEMQPLTIEGSANAHLLIEIPAEVELACRGRRKGFGSIA
jgi:hypothetical protein